MVHCSELEIDAAASAGDTTVPPTQTTPPVVCEEDAGEGLSSIFGASAAAALASFLSSWRGDGLPSSVAPAAEASQAVGSAAPELSLAVRPEPSAAAPARDAAAAAAAAPSWWLGRSLCCERKSGSGARLWEAVAEVWGAQLKRIGECPLVASFAEPGLLRRTWPLFMIGTAMGTLYFSFAGVYMPLAGLHLSSATSVVFHASFVMSLFSYHQAVITDPGRIPDNWRAQTTSNSETWHRTVFRTVERKKTNGCYRFCTKENKFKPDRSHYCRELGRNVLRMDHWCPWLSNCVGFYNHKFFLLFLFYMTIVSNITWAHVLPALAFGTFSSGQTFILADGCLLSAVTAVFMTPFFGFHCWLTARNVTTLEFSEQGLRYRAISPFDCGVLANVQSVMGRKAYLWLFPVGNPPGNGTEFKTQDPPTGSSSSTQRAK